MSYMKPVPIPHTPPRKVGTTCYTCYSDPMLSDFPFVHDELHHPQWHCQAYAPRRTKISRVIKRVVQLVHHFKYSLSVSIVIKAPSLSGFMSKVSMV